MSAKNSLMLRQKAYDFIPIPLEQKPQQLLDPISLYNNTKLSVMSSIVHTFTQSVQSILPYAEAAIGRNLRITNIMKGAGFTLAGVGLVTASFQGRASSSLKWGSRLAGLAMTCYGVYSILQGMYQPRLPIHILSDIRPMQGTMSCQEALERAKKELLSCNNVKKLWNQVENEGAFVVRCATASESVPAGALTWVDKREIVVSDKISSTMTRGLLFELLNLKQAKAALQLNQKACAIGMEPYVHQIRAIEYKTAQAAYRRSKVCVSEGIWDKSLLWYQELFENPAIKDPKWIFFANSELQGHADIYRSNWQAHCIQRTVEL